LAADADNPQAVAQIFALKGRPPDHPLIVHVLGPAQVPHYAAMVPLFAQKLIDGLWPGPITLILPRRAGVAEAAAGGQDSIGLRCPAHPTARALLAACLAQSPPVRGLAAPSANRFGRVSPTTAQHVVDEFGGAVPVLDGGPCQVGIESTIIDCTRGAPVLLRPGQLPLQQIEQCCGQKVLLKSERVVGDQPAPKASGTLESHYAPEAKLRLMDTRSLQTALMVLGAEIDKTPGDGQARKTPLIAVWSRSILKSKSENILRRRMPDDADATAQQLFAVLREFDAQGVKLIWVEEPPDTPAWAGVRDRLTRAAA
jgi:L-threonylcarbamoyladenylate synthase